MKISKEHEVWLIVGSQHLYGKETLETVASNAKELARTIDSNRETPVDLKFRQVVTTPEEVYQVCNQANYQDNCIGVVTWMHTFSPAKMWIRGLSILNKPLAHLHTQFNQSIPWDQIDMDFMNLNQAAHGDREFGHLLSRMRLKRKVIVGHWKSERVVEQLGNWMRAALGWCTFKQLKVARFGDNMRDVAVTEGDKVAAQVSLGFSVNGYGLGDLVEVIKQVEPKQVEALIEQYQEEYLIDQQVLISESLKEAARIELGLRYFLQEGGFGAFTNTFENLHGLHQLPGIAVQRLMNDGYGFGAEGDWKTAALLRIIKVMNEGMIGGSSFMEDYTYHFTDDRSLVLGAHMLEICPSIASSKPKCEVHPLPIGGKEAPARLVFDVNPGAALNLSLIDMGNRFRLLANKVKVVKPEKSLPKLPVARVLWDPQPSLEASAHCWLLAGGAHHTVFSMAANIEMIEDLAEMAGIELLLIDQKTTVNSFKDKIRWNEAYYHQFQNNV